MLSSSSCSLSFVENKCADTWHICFCSLSFIEMELSSWWKVKIAYKQKCVAAHISWPIFHLHFRSDKTNYPKSIDFLLIILVIGQRNVSNFLRIRITYHFYLYCHPVLDECILAISTKLCDFRCHSLSHDVLHHNGFSLKSIHNISRSLSDDTLLSYHTSCVLCVCVYCMAYQLNRIEIWCVM